MCRIISKLFWSCRSANNAREREHILTITTSVISSCSHPRVKAGKSPPNLWLQLSTPIGRLQPNSFTNANVQGSYQIQCVGGVYFDSDSPPCRSDLSLVAPPNFSGPGSQQPHKAIAIHMDHHFACDLLSTSSPGHLRHGTQPQRPQLGSTCQLG